MQAQHSWISGALVIAVLLGAVVFSCSPGFAQSFTDQTASLVLGSDGLGYANINITKVAWGDYDNDGYVDILAGNNNLWKNVAGPGGTRRFAFVAVPGGLGGLWADYNNDGLIDVYNYSNKTLHRNQSTPSTTSFVQVSIPSLPMGVSNGASWADHDNDGYVDLYVGGYENPSYQPDAILHNQSGTSFIKSWQQTGDIDPARGITSCDFDRDGDQDVYVSNYRLEANLLWQNDGNGNFANVAPSKGVAGTYDGWSSSYGHTIGSAWGDLDNDGYMDLFVGNFSHPDAWQDRPRFYKNLGPGYIFPDGNYTFEDKSATAGLAWQESYASPALGDYDNDGDLDLFFTTVYSGDHPVLYRNNGNWTFTDVTAAEGLANLGRTYQAAWADFDNDGDLDLVTDGKLFVNSESQTDSNHWLKVKLTGDGTTVNSAAIGSEVRINVGGKTLTRQVEGGTGEGNQNDLTLHFGLGSHDGPVDLQISWADGTNQTINGVAVDNLAVVELTPPSEVHYHFDEVAVGQWEVSVEVTGEGTSGLSAYSVWVYNTDPALVNYTENTLFDLASFSGFLPPNLAQGDVGGDFNAGNYQSAGDYAITGIGIDPVSQGDVDLDVPGLLGILSTPGGLGPNDFAALSAGLLNETNDDYLTEMIVTYEVNPLDWLLGDANHDGLVGADDYVSIQANFGNSGAAGILGDANFDGLVSADDYASVQANFGNISSASAVPEPATLGLLLVGGLALLRRRRA